MVSCVYFTELFQIWILCVASSPPESLQGVVESETAIKLTWNAPSAPNGRITGYQVIYSSREGVSVSKAL